MQKAFAKASASWTVSAEKGANMSKDIVKRKVKMEGSTNLLS